jgi:hypothetical protein
MSITFSVLRMKIHKMEIHELVYLKVSHTITLE